MINANPDAIYLPNGLVDTRDYRRFLHATFLWVKPIMGYRSKANPHFKETLRPKGDGLITRGQFDTLLFGSTEDRAGQDRFTWVKLADHPRAEEYRTIIAKHAGLLTGDIMASVKVGYYAEGAGSDAA